MKWSPLDRSVLSLSLVAALACNAGGGNEGSDGSSGGTGSTAGTGDTPTTGTGTSGATGGPAAAKVVLNEMISKAAVAGIYADRGDAVEIFNASDASVDLSGWKLSDDPTFPADKTYVFPAGSTLGPGAFLVLTEFDAMGFPDALPFGISSNAQETVTLADADGAVADEQVVDGADAEVSYCRLPDGTGDWQRCEQTLGEENTPALATCGNATIEPTEACDGTELAGQTCTGLGFTGGTLACSALCSWDGTQCDTDSEVVINELEATEDTIELYNAGAMDVDLKGWILTDKWTGTDYDPPWIRRSWSSSSRPPSRPGSSSTSTRCPGGSCSGSAPPATRSPCCGPT